MQHGFGSGPHAAAPRSCRNRRFTESPIDVLVYLVVGSGMGRQITIRLELHPVVRLRIAVIPQRWSACRGNVLGLGVNPDVINDLADLHALGNECDQDAHR